MTHSIVIHTTQVSEKPSIGIIFLEPVGQNAAVDRLSFALSQRGYIPATAAPPAGYPLAQDEWLAFALISTDDPKGECILLDELDATFRVALWLSAAFQGQLFVGWRRFRGLGPTMKVFMGGQPRWKIGSDPDHEVDFTVPAHPPHDVPSPESVGLPADLGAAARREGIIPISYQEAVKKEGESIFIRSFISRRSPLAP